MTSPSGELAQLLRTVRRECGKTQRDLAAAVGCSQPYIAQLETDRRPISLKYAELIEKELKLEAGALTRQPVRGRPPMNQVAREALAEIRKAENTPKVEYTQLPPPKYPRVDTAKPRDNAFEQVSDDQFLQALEEELPHDEHSWKRANMVRFDSNPERFFLLRIFWMSAMVVCASFGSLGCSLRSANGLTGKNTDHLAYPTFLLWYEGIAVAVMPQRCVRTAYGYRWPDLTLVLAKNGRKVTIVIEVDGPSHKNRYIERQRDLELGVPVYHVTTDCVELPGLLETILADAALLLAA